MSVSLLQQLHFQLSDQVSRLPSIRTFSPHSPSITGTPNRLSCKFTLGPSCCTSAVFAVACHQFRKQAQLAQSDCVAGKSVSVTISRSSGDSEYESLRNFSFEPPFATCNRNRNDSAANES